MIGFLSLSELQAWISNLGVYLTALQTLAVSLQLPDIGLDMKFVSVNKLANNARRAE